MHKQAKRVELNTSVKQTNIQFAQKMEAAESEKHAAKQFDKFGVSAARELGSQC